MSFSVDGKSLFGRVRFDRNACFEKSDDSVECDDKMVYVILGFGGDGRNCAIGGDRLVALEIQGYQVEYGEGDK
jgi:hypothetical protein